MANRTAIGLRGKPTTITNGNNTFQVVDYIYDQIGVGGTFAVNYAVVRLATSPPISGSITLTMPNGDTFTTSNYTYSVTGSIQTYTGGSANPLFYGPYIKLSGYGETDYQNTPITIGAPESRGAFISGLSTGGGNAGTSADPFPGADVVGVSNKGVLENTTFDSGAHIGGGLQVFYKTQGTINVATTDTNGIRYVDITHNWGKKTGAGTNDRPAYAVRWTPSTHIVNGLANIAYGPWDQFSQSETGYFPNVTETEKYYYFKPIITANTKDTIRLQARSWQSSVTNGVFSSSVPDGSGTPDRNFHYALVVFYENNFKNGDSL